MTKHAFKIQVWQTDYSGGRILDETQVSSVTNDPSMDRIVVPRSQTMPTNMMGLRARRTYGRTMQHAERSDV